MKEPLVDCVEIDQINTNQCMVLDLDLKTMKLDDMQFSSEYSLTFMRSDKVHAIVAWFDCLFSLPQHKVKLSTSPYTNYTHWKQVVFYMDSPIEVEQGEVLKGSIACRKAKQNFREQDIKISYHFEGEHQNEDYVQMYKLR